MGVDERSPREIFSSLVLVIVGDADDNVRFGGFLRLKKGGGALVVDGTELKVGDRFRTTQGEIVELFEVVDLYPTEFGAWAITDAIETETEVTLRSGEIGDFLWVPEAEDEKPAEAELTETPVS